MTESDFYFPFFDDPYDNIFLGRALPLRSARLFMCLFSKCRAFIVVKLHKKQSVNFMFCFGVS